MSKLALKVVEKSRPKIREDDVGKAVTRSRTNQGLADIALSRKMKIRVCVKGSQDMLGLFW
jgi:ribosome-binding protein aMBF1 (putative translation factor)